MNQFTLLGFNDYQWLQVLRFYKAWRPLEVVPERVLSAEAQVYASGTPLPKVLLEARIFWQKRNLQDPPKSAMVELPTFTSFSRRPPK